MDIISYLSFFIPQIILALTAVFGLVAEMFHRSRLGLVIALTGYSAAGAVAISMLGTDQLIFENTYRVDSLSLWANIILTAATAACVLLWREKWRGHQREGSGYVFFTLATLGSIMLAGAGDLMFIVLGTLMTSIASFALIGWPQTIKSTEAAMKYFIYASVSGAVMLFGFTYWYGIAGTTLLSDLTRLETMPLAALIGLIGLIMGVGYQASLVPVHQWTPDVYQGASVPVAAYMSVVTKIGALFALAQIAQYLPENIPWRLIIALIAAATILLGTVAALSQRNVIRLLAYSSIAQTGYFLFAIITVGIYAGSLNSLIVFSAAYAAMNIGAFAVAEQQGKRIKDFAGAMYVRPYLSLAMIIFLLSLVGIPPLAGFIGKFLLFGSALAGNFIWLAVVGIIGSVIALGAYLRIVMPILPFFSDKKQAIQAAPTKVLTTFIWISMLTLTIFLGIGSQVFF
jgi:NADH-quinone oxidoreductase subunit N